MTENHDAQQVNREYDVGVKSSIGAILDLSRTVLLCAPEFARASRYQGLMNPTPHKWEDHIRTERSRCHAFTKVAANPASLVAGEQAQAVALPRRSSRQPHYQGGGGGRVPKGASNLPDF